MQPEQLINHRDNKTNVKVNLKDERFFSGHVKDVVGNTLIFLDKYGSEIIIDLDSIAYVVPVVRKDGGKEDGSLSW